MRKVLSLLLISIFTVGLALANPVNKEKARVAALNVYINYAPESIKDYSITKELTTEKNGMATFYTFVFNAGGFVMISADDAAIPVLAYSHNSPYREDITNPAVKEWYDGYSNQIEAIRDQKLSNEVTLEKWNDVLNNRFPKNEKAVLPLLTTNWGQGGVFDNYVPAGTPVGCVATAMAQIMNFWEYPETGSNWHSYTHPTYGEQTAMFFATTYDWANMPDNTGSDASAILSYHLGVAVNMNYATDGSGAFSQDATYVLANYFKYDQGIDHVEKADFSDAEWTALLKFELDNGRPILYSGSSTASGGHAFVCDGYNDGGNFHFNWGWDGSANAHYAIGSLNPSGSDFNSGNSIVFRIKPAANEDAIDFKWVQKNSNFPINSTYPSYIDAVDENVAWAIGRDGSGNNIDFKVYSVTKDGGATWTSQTLNFGTAFSMINGVSADIAFIAAYGSGTGNKIIKTADGGETWDVVLSGGGASSFFNVVHFFDENNGFVQGDPLGGEYELYTTTDGGANWTRVPGADIPNPADASEYGIVGMYDAVGDMIWFTTNNGYIYKSTDKGYTWTKHLIAAGGDTNIEIAFDETGTIGLANYYMNSNYSKYKSTDGGGTWEELTHSGDFYDSGLSFVPGTESMWVSVGSDYQTPKMGISYTTDGGATWQQYANYYKNFQITGLDMASINKGYAGTFRNEVGGGIWIMGGVTPDFSVDDNQICEGVSVTFTGSSLATAESIEWNFGDGATPATSADYGPISVSYSTAGLKTIELTFTIDGTEYTETKVDYIEVIDCSAIVPDFTADEVVICEDGTVVFTGISLEMAESVSWNFGEGATPETSTEIGPIAVTYSTIGLKTVELVAVINGETSTETKVDYIEVRDCSNISETNEAQFEIYPNPSNGVFNITSESAGNVTVVNAVGQVVYEKDVNQQDVVNLKGFDSGVYFVRFKNENKVSTQRIVIQ